MAYLAYLIAGIMLLFQRTEGMSLTQGVDRMLDNAIAINQAFFYASIVIWLIGVVTILFLWNSGNASLNINISGCGCLLFPLIILPVSQFIIWQLNIQMANSFGADGPTDPVRFAISLFVTLLLGAG